MKNIQIYLEQMKINFTPLSEEIIAHALNPTRIGKIFLENKFNYNDWV